MNYRLLPSDKDFEGYKVIEDATGTVVAVTVTRELGYVSVQEKDFANFLVSALNSSWRPSPAMH